MRAPALLALLGAVLVAAAPIVPMASNKFAIALTDDRVSWTCSLLGIARESFRSDEMDLDGRRPAGCGLRIMRALDDSRGFNGRFECGALFALALLAAAAVNPRWTRHAPIVAALVAAVAAWTWWALRSEMRWLAIQLPGGLGALNLWDWIRPWPFVLAASSTLSLALAGSLARRAIRRANVVEARVPKIFE